MDNIKDISKNYTVNWTMTHRDVLKYAVDK
jgi:hypothetical protein